jgi:DNA primase
MISNQKQLIVNSYRSRPEKFLTELGITVRSARGEYYLAYCPFHDDSSPSFSIHKSHGGWVCFSGCGKGDLFKLIGNSYSLNDRTDFKKIVEIGLKIGGLK